MTTVEILKNTGKILNRKLKNGKGYKNAFDDAVDFRNGYTDLSNVTLQNNEKLWKYDRNSLC